jgi:hypothetical protein
MPYAYDTLCELLSCNASHAQESNAEIPVEKGSKATIQWLKRTTKHKPHACSSRCVAGHML